MSCIILDEDIQKEWYSETLLEKIRIKFREMEKPNKKGRHNILKRAAEPTEGRNREREEIE